MPFLFTVEARYDQGTYVLSNPHDLINNFPFLEGSVVVARVVSTYRDGRIIRIDKELRFKLLKTEKPSYQLLGEILNPNPLKFAGLPLPSPLLIIVYKYEHTPELGEFPVAESLLVKGTIDYRFEDDAKRLLKEAETGIILEGTIFHEQLRKLASNLKEALLSFEQENFANSKTSCRKVLERIKQLVNDWDTVDGSKSLSEKFRSVISSLYSFATVGGPHEGIATREETEVVLKTTTAGLLYVNSLLKNERVITAINRDQRGSP